MSNCNWEKVQKQEINVRRCRDGISTSMQTKVAMIFSKYTNAYPYIFLHYSEKDGGMGFCISVFTI